MPSGGLTLPPRNLRFSVKDCRTRILHGHCNTLQYRYLNNMDNAFSLSAYPAAGAQPGRWWTIIVTVFSCQHHRRMMIMPPRSYHQLTWFNGWTYGLTTGCALKTNNQWFSSSFDGLATAPCDHHLSQHPAQATALLHNCVLQDIPLDDTGGRGCQPPSSCCQSSYSINAIDHTPHWSGKREQPSHA
jgi:hypothetical protein